MIAMLVMGEGYFPIPSSGFKALQATATKGTLARVGPQGIICARPSQSITASIPL